MMKRNSNPLAHNLEFIDYDWQPEYSPRCHPPDSGL